MDILINSWKIEDSKVENMFIFDDSLYFQYRNGMVYKRADNDKNEFALFTDDLCIMVYQDTLYTANVYIEQYKKRNNQLKFATKSKLYTMGGITALLFYNNLLYVGTNNGIFILKENGTFVEQKSQIYVQCMKEFNGLIYTGTIGGKIHVLDRENKCVRVLDEIANYYSNWLKDINAMIVYNKLLYAGASGGIIAAWNSNGECVHIMHMDNTFYHSVKCFAVYNNLLYVGSNEGMIIAINQSGKIIKISEFECNSIGCLIVWNERLYSGNSDGTIYAFGEYYPNHFDSLPSVQKNKFKNWQKTRSWFQKDLHLLFVRELLL